MSKVSYAKLNLKPDKSVSTFEFEGVTIEVKNYLPMEDKDSLIRLTLQKAEEESGFYNRVLIDMYFMLNMVYMYTNLSFTDKQRENEFAIYDNLCSSGFMDLFLKTVDEEEHRYLVATINDVMEMSIKFKNTFAGAVKMISESLPTGAKDAKDIIESFNKEDFQEVLNFARAANGGRSISQKGQN